MEAVGTGGGRLCGEEAAGGGGVPGTSGPAVHWVGRDPGQLTAYLPGGWRNGSGLEGQRPYYSHGVGGRREQSKPEAIWTEEVTTSDPRTWNTPPRGMYLRSRDFQLARQVLLISLLLAACLA